MKARIFFIFLFLYQFSFSQKVFVEVDTTNIRIGEQFLFQISIDDTSNVILPESLEKLKSLEVVQNRKLDTVRNRLIKKYVMTGFDSGSYYIPSQQVFIKNRSYLTDSILINVATVAVDTTKQKMFPIKAIQNEPFILDDFKPYFIWIILTILLIVGLVYYLMNRKKHQEVQKEVNISLPPFEEAIDRLQKLDSKLLWQNNEIKKYYSELTEIIRSYLEKELKIPALEITTLELIKMLDNFKQATTIEIENETIKKLNALLNEADLVKFAKSKPLSHEIEQDRRDAEDILNSLKPKPLIEETEHDELE